tara:strand:+ start:349 stop:897 length:549 start_codon:yes stop_codon:yes gene_type:complete
MRKGQVEIIGLVIIVILITLGMLFALVFFINKEPPEKKVFVRKGLAYSTVGALLQTSADCNNPANPDDVQIKDLLEACANDRFAGFNNLQCFNQDNQPTNICEFTKGEIEELLEMTLGKWKKDYELNIELYSNVEGVDPQSLFEQTIISGNGCPGERDSSGIFPLQFRELGSIIETELILCE